ncbi:MAG: DUF1697 domain-containing protein [Microbacterium hominis]|jgi:uncharacterized protein (DUF1697 family)|uniref:DUF1697 domain-containing protein n=1 Tax=Microbacterium aurum TaxID=36805 RepID=UPI00248EE03D|nr:DUF1697 domain-containing protein [Microbacterium aurum]MBZ6371493.1 DUF1697 domain-containing protein [Microbacterium hominis]
MTTWVALLRGVNVGGVTVRSAELAALFRDLGFDRVTTVLASGNVRFEADAAASARADLTETIERALGERFDYEAWIVLVTMRELDAAIAGFPFDAGDAGRQPYVVFCRDRAVREALAHTAEELESPDDLVQPGFGVVYWSPPKGRSVDTPFAKVLARSSYTGTTTTRNLRTLAKIAAAGP